MDNNIPDYQTLMYPILSHLGDNKTHPLKEVMDFLIARFELTEEELMIKVPSGQMGLFKK